MTAKKKKTAATIERATSLVVGTTAAAVATGPAAVGTALMALFPTLVGAFLPGFLDRKGKEIRTWWDEVVGSSGSDEGIAAEIESRMGSPEVQETVMAGVRAILDRLAPDVRTPIALLTREYARACREPDWFFRAVATILTTVTAEEYAAFKAIVATTLASRFGEHATLRLNTQPGFDDVLAPLSFTTDPVGYLNVRGGLGVMRVFALLQSTGLGAPPKGGMPGVSDSRLVVFRPGVLGRLGALLRNPAV